MEEIRIDKLGIKGVNLDLNEISLEPNVFTTSQNARFDRGRIRNFSGNRAVTAAVGTYHQLLPIQGLTNYYWYFANNTSIQEWDGTTVTDRTNVGGAYAGASRNRWNGGPFHGIPVLNNGVDAPQYLAEPGALGGAFVDLPWNAAGSWTDEGVTAKVVRPHRNFLVAMDITTGGSRDPHKLIWSSAADPGAIPASWDKDDGRTLLTGETSLSETSGHIVDALPLGRDLIVYKEDGIYRMSFVGAPYVFKFDLITDEYGLRAQGCVVDVGGAHIFLGHNGVFLQDGTNVSPLAYGRVSEHIFGDISGTEYEQAFLTANPSEHEVWVCYPDASADVFPNACLVFNHKDNTWYPRDIPSETATITPGVDLESTGGDAIEDLTGTIEDQQWSYIDRTYNPTILRLHGLSESTFYKYDTDQQFGGVDPICKAERTGLSIGSPNKSHTITAIYPEMSGSDVVDWYIGVQDHPGASVSWEGPFEFDPNSDVKIDPLVTAPVHGIKIQSTNGAIWELTAMTIEYEFSGVF